MGMITPLWRVERDGKVFATKKEAEAWDQTLELADAISELITVSLEDVSDKQGEAIGLLLAKNADTLAKACKGKPELLTNLLDSRPEEAEEEAESAELSAVS
ncbi:YebG family protein [Endozoicomonadaceae bacterium StTr2]